tara:strand:- start:209 stop:445 length:237 start_codon:yes stop_codon:yes gene_type:complete
MTKREARAVLLEKSKEGYIVHSMLLDLYDDADDIPEGMINLMAHKAEPKELIIPTGMRGMEMFHEAMKEESKKMLIEE